MTNKNYEQLKKIIIKTNPNIMDLTFGCIGKFAVEHGNSIGKIAEVYKIKGKIDGYSAIFYEEDLKKDKLEIFFNKKSLLKIIGREITFSDILIALQNQKYYNDIEITTNHKKQKASINVFNINGKTTYFTWNLINNSLYWHWENQRKTCVALFSILYKDKDIKNE